MDDSLLDYALEIIERTRQSERLTLGVSPRGSLMLQRAAQARAFIEGRDFCLPDDFKQLVLPVFAHRVVVNTRYATTQKKIGAGRSHSPRNRGNYARPTLMGASPFLADASVRSRLREIGPNAGPGTGPRGPGAGAPSSWPSLRSAARCCWRSIRRVAARRRRRCGSPGLRRSPRWRSPPGWPFTLVPALARRTPLRWLAYRIDYRVTREGIVYLGGNLRRGAGRAQHRQQSALHDPGLPARRNSDFRDAFATGAERRRGAPGSCPNTSSPASPVLALAELINHKQRMPSFSLRLVGVVAPRSREGSQTPERDSDRAGLFPLRAAPSRPCSKASSCAFRGAASTARKLLGLRTRFPFGFLEKTRQRRFADCEAVVYPPSSRPEKFHEILPLVSRRTGKLLARPRPRSLRHPRLPDFGQRTPRGLEGLGQNGTSCRCVSSRAKTSAAFCWYSTRLFRRRRRLAAQSDARLRARRDAVRQPGLAFLRNQFRAGISQRRIYNAYRRCQRRHLRHSAPLGGRSAASVRARPIVPRRTRRRTANLQDHRDPPAARQRFPPAFGVHHYIVLLANSAGAQPRGALPPRSSDSRATMST